MDTRTTALSGSVAAALFLASPVTVSADDTAGLSGPGSPSEPIRIVSDAEPDFAHHDGALPPVMGAHQIQVMRANRGQPNAPGADGLGWTYNHAPMLSYWKGTFYLEYLANPVGEHIPPGQTLLVESTDGYSWTRPRIAFPPFRPEGETNRTVSHQRMGFFVAPNDRLLLLSFYGRAPRPNDGTGVGRAVREIREDGTLGPIHFIRYNRHAGFDETNTPYPPYTEAEDAGFVAACEALLADKLMTQQWWEEDRSNDGFYAIRGADRGFDAKALSFYHRDDGTVVGLWKKRWAALSFNEGRSWTQPVRVPTLITGGAKIWGQRTDDGRYALAFNPHAGHRWPLVVVTGPDGVRFDDMRVAHGEIPYPRYDGQYKSMGPQYVRGIAEGNGDPPGSDLWLTYSVNKEDIWVTRLPVPISGGAVESVDDSFENQSPGLPVQGWNVYCPVWAPVALVPAPDDEDGLCLELRDEDRYDYAQALRLFPPAQKPRIRFRVRAEQFNGGRLEIDVLDGRGRRPIQLVLSQQGIQSRRSGSDTVGGRTPDEMRLHQWVTLEIQADVERQHYDLTVDGAPLLRQEPFANRTSHPLERLCLRTGAHRDYDAHAVDLLIDESELGDRLDGDDKQPLTHFYVDDVQIRSE